jgi:hypothetical protein
MDRERSRIDCGGCGVGPGSVVGQGVGRCGAGAISLLVPV